MRRRLCQICFIKFWSFSAISALFMAFRSQIHVQKSFLRNSKILVRATLTVQPDPPLFEVFNVWTSNSTLNQDKQYCITNSFIKNQFSDFDDDSWFSSSKNLPQIEHSTNWILFNWFIGANIYGFLNNLRWVTFDLWLRIQFLDSRQPHQSNSLFQFLTFHLGRIPWNCKNARIHRIQIVLPHTNFFFINTMKNWLKISSMSIHRF